VGTKLSAERIFRFFLFFFLFSESRARDGERSAVEGTSPRRYSGLISTWATADSRASPAFLAHRLIPLLPLCCTVLRIRSTMDVVSAIFGKLRL
jgi:hypothetical protein